MAADFTIERSPHQLCPRDFSHRSRVGDWITVGDTSVRLRGTLESRESQITRHESRITIHDLRSSTRHCVPSRIAPNSLKTRIRDRLYSSLKRGGREDCFRDAFRRIVRCLEKETKAQTARAAEIGAAVARRARTRSTLRWLASSTSKRSPSNSTTSPVRGTCPATLFSNPAIVVTFECCAAVFSGTPKSSPI